MMNSHPLLDTSNQYHPYAKVLVPGIFFVLQGMDGDGLSNTMDRLPELVSSIDARRLQQSTRPENAQAETRGAPSQNALVLPSSRPTGSVFSSVASSTLPATARSVQLYGGHVISSLSATGTVVDAARLLSDAEGPSPTTRSDDEDSFLVVSDENMGNDVDETDRENSARTGDSIARSTETLPAILPTSEDSLNDSGASGLNLCHRRERAEELSVEQLLALERWTGECRNHERLKRQEWRELLVGSAEASYLCLENPWWIDAASGQLKVFDVIPSIHGEEAAVVGTLPPGTSLFGTEIVTLDLESWDVIDAKPKIVPADNDDTALQKLYSQGRTRWIQFLKVEPNLESQPHGEVTGFSVMSWNGYAYLAPGSLSLYVNPSQWIWRVTSPAGAYVREGLDLTTRRIATVPYGHQLVVDGKTVNAMGLSRLHVAYQNGSGDVVTGWCSEQMNPLSGRRESILQPLPMPAPARYRVVLPDGAIVRNGVELSSRRIGRATHNTVLSVTTRCFSEHPTDRCLQRLRLAGDGGWISFHLSNDPPELVHVVDFEGTDESFDPNFPGRFHIRTLQQVHQEKERSRLAAQRRERNRRATSHPSSQSRLSPDLSSVDESATSAADDDAPHLRGGDDHSTTSASSPYEDDLGDSIYSAKAWQAADGGTTGDCRGPGAVHHSNHREDRCLICLCDERTATIVHGETGHIACCLTCARILKARHDNCPVCRLPIDAVIQHFWA